MPESFLIPFTRALQNALILSFVLAYPQVTYKTAYRRSLSAGALAAIIAGFSAGYFPDISTRLWSNETWTFWRYASWSVIFYFGITLIAARSRPSEFTACAGLIALGFSIFIFDSRTAGFLIHDIGIMKGNVIGTNSLALLGISCGLAPLFFLRNALRKFPMKLDFTFSGILVLAGALKFAFGGVRGIDEGDIVFRLQNGFSAFLENTVRHAQSVLLIPDHPFLNIPFSGFAHFLAGDRAAMTLTELFLLIPPLFILIHIFARPDPSVDNLRAASQRRLAIAFFRKEIISQTTPVMLALITLIFIIHSSNIRLNPLYEPVPITVREAENKNQIYIPLSDKLGDFTDKKLRKYVYYYGNKQIIFLAILKPDGSLGVALDQCEICRPAEWNKDAQGYAQKGSHLICKYCMTPIALPTVNSPGGCNPIPVPFKVDDNNIVVSSDDLITTYKNAEALDKKGTHF